MEFASPLMLLVLPLVYLSSRISLTVGSSGPANGKRECLLFLALLFLCIFPAFSFIWKWGLSIAVWKTTHPIGSFFWPIAMGVTLAVAVFRRHWSVTAIGGALSVYFVAFPLAYTTIQGIGFLGPGLREVLFIAVTILLNDSTPPSINSPRYALSLTTFLSTIASIFAAFILHAYYQINLVGRAF
jgi:hypothetical protein